MNTKEFGAIAIGVIALGTGIIVNRLLRQAEKAQQSKTEAFITKAFKDAGLNGELRFTHKPEFTATYTSYGETMKVSYFEKVPELLQSTISILKLFEAANK